MTAEAVARMGKEPRQNMYNLQVGRIFYDCTKFATVDSLLFQYNNHTYNKTLNMDAMLPSLGSSKSDISTFHDQACADSILGRFSFSELVSLLVLLQRN